MNLYRVILRPWLFRLDAETAHRLAVAACGVVGALPLLPGLARRCLHYTAPNLQTEVAGLRVDNPLGLAAGWDKSGQVVRMLDHLGFGFVEIGSISARPSLGNPRPRLFRLPQDRAIVVNYGVPNEGAARVARRLAAYRPRVPLGVNLVKTNDARDAPACSDEEVLDDYERSAALLHPHASYLALSLNCPNMKGGRDVFAQPGNLARLLARLRALPVQCPVFLKVAPSLDPADHQRWLDEAGDFDFVRGFIFNLPRGKPETLQLSTPRSVWEAMPGAVSGQPVEALINQCIREFYRRLPPGRFAIIGAGGVFTAADAYRKIRLGASLVQIYTALIYEGPGVVKRINRGLSELLERDGFRTVSEAVGTEA
jgi:dihydroorotate dehydrogenase (fumarate)/dihydroorotate dehydrogenase